MGCQKSATFQTTRASLPTTSLVITTYNKPEYLRVTLATALKQTLPPHEIIIADDGSKEANFEVSREFRKQTDVPIIHVWQEDLGHRLNRSRNNAIAVASGEYIALLDGDCFIGPHFIEDHARAARKNRYVAGTRTHILAERRDYILKTNDTRVTLFTSGTTKRLHSIRSRILAALTSQLGTSEEVITWENRHGVAGANLAFWREDALKVNGFDERFEGYGGNDVEFANRLTHSGILRYQLRHLAVAYHFAHGERQGYRVIDNDMITQMSEENAAEVKRTGICRIPDEYGVMRALNGQFDRIEK